MNTYKSRKFLIALSALIFFCVALWFGKLDQKNYVDIFKWVVLTYTGGNVIQKFNKEK